MKSVTTFFGAGALFITLILVFLIGPVITLWVINSLAEAGGSTFYIEHNLWNYWTAFVLLLCVRGGSTSK